MGSSEALLLGSVLHDEIKADIVLGADIVSIFVRAIVSFLNVAI